MYRKRFSNGLQWTAVAIALGVSGVALADDSSISRLTGDSYAYFNGLGYRAGHFNVEKPKARASTGTTRDAPMASGDAAKKDASSVTIDRSNETAPAAESKILLASPRLVIMPPVTFKEDTA